MYHGSVPQQPWRNISSALGGLATPHLRGKYRLPQMLRASLDKTLVGLGVTWAPLQSGHEAGAADRSTDLQILRTHRSVSMYGECHKVPDGYALWKWFLKDGCC